MDPKHRCQLIATFHIMIKERAASRAMGVNSTDSLLKFAVLVLVCCITIFETQDKVHFNDLFSESAPKEIAKRSTAGFQMVSLAQTLRYFHTQGTIFLDTRKKQDYDSGHIEGALNLPIETIPKISAEQFTRWKRAPVIVIYCDGVFDGTGYCVTRMLTEKGLKNVETYPEGWPEWKNCQLPIAISQDTKQDFTTGKP
jgi:rhodanese-related sulfurtransferase